MKKSPPVVSTEPPKPLISVRSSVTEPNVEVARIETVPALSPAFAEIEPVATCLFVLCVVKVLFVPVGICCVKIALIEHDVIMISESCSTVKFCVFGVDCPPVLPDAPIPPQSVKLRMCIDMGFHCEPLKLIRNVLFPVGGFSK